MAPLPTSSSPGINETSNLCKITVSSNDPIELFKEWFEAAQQTDIHLPHRVCVSSSSSTGHVTSRSLILRQLDEDGFIIMTDRRSIKFKQWEENPRAAFTFFWGYKKGERVIARQVRSEGNMEELPTSEYVHIYNREPLYCKIRSYICHQGQKVEWDELKASHDTLLQNFKDGLTSLPIPDNVVFYKMHPTMFDFYEADDITIGDRVIFSQDNGVKEWKSSWTHHHVAA